MLFLFPRIPFLSESGIDLEKEGILIRVFYSEEGALNFGIKIHPRRTDSSNNQTENRACSCRDSHLVVIGTILEHSKEAFEVFR